MATWKCEKCGVINQGAKKKCSFCGQHYPRLRHRSAAEQIVEFVSCQAEGDEELLQIVGAII
jgi:hypothetical protein